MNSWKNSSLKFFEWAVSPPQQSPRIEQPVDAFQILMVVAYWLLIFRRKFLMVVAYFWIIDRANLTIHWELQDLSTISPSISPKQPWLMKVWKNSKIKIPCNLTYQYQSSPKMHKLLNRNKIKPVLGCLANCHELLNDFRVKGWSCLSFEEISTSRKMVAYKCCL